MSDPKAMLKQNIEQLIQQLINHQFEHKTEPIFMDTTIFNQNYQLEYKDTSQDVIARFIAFKVLPKATEQRKWQIADYLAPMIDPFIEATISESEIDRLLGIPKDSLQIHTDMGLLSTYRHKCERVYYWDQIRKMFGLPPQTNDRGDYEL
ncbi:hypothetical protein [Fodinibius sp. AD559]|uniref:hypothetical protein n=1 Tax=Fodinibius sp. AD559 TaxID=3424179 RepID=UPI004046CFAB